jgi:hypothetical protein
MVTRGTCRESCVRSPARWTFDKFLSYSMRLLPLSADLLGMPLLAELGRVNTGCSDTFSRIASNLTVVEVCESSAQLKLRLCEIPWVPDSHFRALDSHLD